MRGAWTESVGKHRDSGVGCRAICDGCGKYKDVDLAAIAEARGDDFVLWGKRSTCKITPGCKGVVKFFENGRGGFFHIMRDPAGGGDKPRS